MRPSACSAPTSQTPATASYTTRGRARARAAQRSCTRFHVPRAWPQVLRPEALALFAQAGSPPGPGPDGDPRTSGPLHGSIQPVHRACARRPVPALCVPRFSPHRPTAPMQSAQPAVHATGRASEENSGNGVVSQHSARSARREVRGDHVDLAAGGASRADQSEVGPQKLDCWFRRVGWLPSAVDGSDIRRAAFQPARPHLRDQCVRW